MTEVCTPEYYATCDPAAAAIMPILVLLLAGLGLFFLTVWAMLRLVPWERVEFRRTFRPCCEEAKYGGYDARTLALGLSMVFLVGVFMVPVAGASPDTAPSLTWSVDLSFADCETTQSDVRYGIKLVDLTVDTAGNVYGLAGCADGNAAGIVGPLVFAFSSSGSPLWTDYLECGSATATCEPGGIRYVPIRSGTLAVTVTDNSLTSTAKQSLIFVNATTGGITNRFEGSFSNNIPVVYGTTSGTDPAGQLAVRYHNATTIDFVGGSVGTGRWAARCTGLNTANCTVLWESVTSPQPSFVAWGGRSNDQWYGIDTSPSTNFIINKDTGAAVNDTANTATSRSEHYYRGSGTDMVRALDISSASLRWARHNKDTLAETVENPTENQVYSGGSARSTDAAGGAYLDGGEDLFFAGRFQVAGPISYVAKYNTTNGLSGMRWNITLDNCDGSVCGSGAAESFLRPIITQTGGLAVGNVFDRGGGGTDDSTWSQVRFYGGAGTPRGDEFTGFASESAAASGPSTSNTDAATGLANFCTSMGFETEASLFLCGLILVAVVIVVMVAATSSFNRRGNAPMIAGAIGGLGMGVFNGLAGIWETWTIAVLIMVAGAVAVALTRRTIGGG